MISFLFKIVIYLIKCFVLIVVSSTLPQIYYPLISYIFLLIQQISLSPALIYQYEKFSPEYSAHWALKCGT